MRAIVFDNEAVQVLSEPDHPKHRVVLAHLAAMATRRRKGRAVTAVVPTAVRVEAGWDRSDPAAATINRFRLVDDALDATAADMAAGIVSRTGVSVADAHVGAVVRRLAADEVVVLTSDPYDMVRVCTPRAIRAIRI